MDFQTDSPSMSPSLPWGHGANLLWPGPVGPAVAMGSTQALVERNRPMGVLKCRLLGTSKCRVMCRVTEIHRKVSEILNDNGNLCVMLKLIHG